MHTDCVVYTGTFQFNRPLEVVGSKDGSVLVGDFVVLPTTPSPSPPPPSSYTTELLLSNPYLRGLPHGENVTIQFKAVFPIVALIDIILAETTMTTPKKKLTITTTRCVIQIHLL